MNEIKLNIDQISEELYLLILEEFKKQNPKVEFFDDWEIKAKAEK
jgi:hypothetical protein